MIHSQNRDRAKKLTKESYDSSFEEFRIYNWMLLTSFGNSRFADELIAILREYDKTPVSRWENSSPFTSDYYLEGITKAITSPSAIAYERYFCESSGHERIVHCRAWRECEETKVVDKVKNAVKAFCENAGAVAKIIESSTLTKWSEAVRVLNETCYGHQEDCCTLEQAKVVVDIIAENTPRLAADVRIWRLAKGNASGGRTNSSERNVTIVGNNNVVGHVEDSRIEVGNLGGRQEVRWRDALKIGWVKLLIAILGLLGASGGVCIYVKFHANDIKITDHRPVANVQVHSNQNVNLSADQLAGNAGKLQFVNCTFNIRLIQPRTDIQSLADGMSRLDGGFLNSVSNLAQDVGISTNGWPLLRNPKGLDMVVQRMEDCLASENAENAVLLARTAERIIDQHWKAYTNGSLSVARDFAANVTRTYVVLAQDALSRNDYPAAKQCCDIAVQFFGKKIPANLRALQIACAIRFGGGVFLCFDFCSMALFKDSLPKEELYEVLNHLAQWGYLVPYFIDFDAKRLLQISYEKSFNFDKPLKYAYQMQLACRTKDGQEIKSNIIINQWKGFDKYEMVDVNQWFRDMIKRFGDDPVVRERSRIYDALKARGLPEI